MGRDSLTTTEKLVGGGAALAAVGSFFPWLTVTALGTTMTVRGINGDGIFIILFAIIAFGIITLRQWSRIDKLAVIGCGLLMTLITGMYIVDPATGMGGGASADIARHLVNPGSGLYMSAVGSLSVLVGGVLGVLSPSSNTAVQQPNAENQ